MSYVITLDLLELAFDNHSHLADVYENDIDLSPLNLVDTSVRLDTDLVAFVSYRLVILRRPLPVRLPSSLRASSCLGG
jgi:hypothetical protein